MKWWWLLTRTDFKFLFRKKVNSFPTQDSDISCWNDSCIWHNSSCNKEKAIVLVSNSFCVQSLIFSSNLRYWESFAPFSCTTTPRAKHMGQWVSVTCTNCALPSKKLCLCTATLGNQNPNSIKTQGENQIYVLLGVCDLLCVLVHLHGGGGG